MKLRTEHLLMLGMAMTTEKTAMEKRIKGIFTKKRTSIFVRVALVAFCLIMGLMCFTSACQPKKVDVLVEKERNELLTSLGEANGSSTDGKKTLTLYVDYILKANHPGIMVKMLDAVKKQNPDYEVSFYDPSNGDSSMSVSDQMTRLNTDLLVGKGPDILVGSTNMFNCTLTTGTQDNLQTQEIDVADIGKQMLSGAYLDIAPYMANDTEFTSDDYYANVIDGVKINGKLCGLPLTFNYQGGITSGDTLSSANVSISSTDSMDALMNAFEAYLKEDDSRQVFEGPGYTSALMLMSVLPQMFDYTNGSVELDSEAIKRILDISKLDDKASGSEYFFDEDWGISSQVEGKYLIKNDSGDIKYILSYGTALESNGGAVYIPYRNTDNGITAQISYIGLINAGTSDHQVAYDSLKAAMKGMFEDVRCTHLGIPILREYATKYISPQGGVAQADFCYRYNEMKKCTVMPQQFFDEFLAHIDEITSVELSTQPFDTVYNAFTPYINGEKAFESCLNEAEYDLMLFLSE